MRTGAGTGNLQASETRDGIAKLRSSGRIIRVWEVCAEGGVRAGECGRRAQAALLVLGYMRVENGHGWVPEVSLAIAPTGTIPKAQNFLHNSGSVHR